MQKYIQCERKNKVIRGGKHRKITSSVGQESLPGEMVFMFGSDSESDEAK